MGVESALRTWKPLLRPGGRLALSEAVWLSHQTGSKAQCRNCSDRMSPHALT
jgi:hypothetical protein